MQKIDLHMHSVYSDGTYTPAKLVEYAKKKGLSAISLNHLPNSKSCFPRQGSNLHKGIDR